VLPARRGKEEEPFSEFNSSIKRGERKRKGNWLWASDKRNMQKWDQQDFFAGQAKGTKKRRFVWAIGEEEREQGSGQRHAPP